MGRGGSRLRALCVGALVAALVPSAAPARPAGLSWQDPLADVTFDLRDGWEPAPTAPWEARAARIRLGPVGRSSASPLQVAAVFAGPLATIAFVECRTDAVLSHLRPAFLDAAAAVLDGPRWGPSERLHPRSAVVQRGTYRWRDDGTDGRRGALFFYVNSRCGPLTGGRGHLLVAWVDLPASVDDRTFQELVERLFRDLRYAEPATDVFEPCGRGPLLLVPGALADAYSDQGSHRSLRASGASIAAAGLLNYGLKRMFRRPRPNDLDRTSFPSGHTAVAASVAGSVGTLHPDLRLTLLGLTAMVGRSRVRSHHHRLVDVLAGGALGYVVGGYFGRRAKASHRSDLDRAVEVGGLMAPLVQLKF